jgi:hypothetical protein
MRPSAQGYLASMEHLFGILSAWNAIPQWSGDPWLRSIGFGDQLSSILVAWKCLSCRVVNSSTPGLLAGSEPLFGFRTARKCDSSRVWDQGYVTSTELLLGIMAAWKCDSSGFLRVSAKGTWLPLSLCSAICWPEKVIPQRSWDLWLKSARVTLSKLFSIFAAWECDTCGSGNPPLQCN